MNIFGANLINTLLEPGFNEKLLNKAFDSLSTFSFFDMRPWGRLGTS